LDFVADVEEAFANLCALVAPGGWLVVLAPSAGPGGWLYKAEKALFGLRVNLFEPTWLKERACYYGLSPAGLCRPLPGNLAMSALRVPMLVMAVNFSMKNPLMSVVTFGCSPSLRISSESSWTCRWWSAWKERNCEATFSCSQDLIACS